MVEDGRLDSRVKSEYAGIRRSYVDVQQTSLGDRPEITELPAREALVEFLVRLSLYQYRGLPAPKEYVRQARKIARAARRVTRTAATVEDAAEATLRIYAVLSEIPNEKLEADDWETIDVDGDDDADEEMDDEALQQLIETAGSDTATEEEDQDYEPSQDVDYRGDFSRSWRSSCRSSGCRLMKVRATANRTPSPRRCWRGCWRTAPSWTSRRWREGKTLRAVSPKTC